MDRDSPPQSETQSESRMNQDETGMKWTQMLADRAKKHFWRGLGQGPQAAPPKIVFWAGPWALGTAGVQKIIGNKINETSCNVISLDFGYPPT